MNTRKLVMVAILAGLVLAPVFAGGNQEVEPPTLDLPAQPRQYISPENADGAQDALVLPFSSVVVPAEDMVIVEYELSVFDADGQQVFTVSERQDERRGFFGNVFGGEKPRVEVPETMTWDGTWSVPEDQLPEGTSNGDLVEDGEYTYQLTVIDDAGNFARSAPFNVTVDNTAPQIREFPTPEYTVFSPNDDDVRDTIAIPLRGSRELSWVVTITDASGAVVRTDEYTNDQPRNTALDVSPPETYVWDGRSDDGQVLEEGSYQLTLTGRDRAGNETSETHPADIVLSLQVAQLRLQPATAPAALSPNGDGVRDELPLTIEASDPSAIRSWQIQIINRDRAVRSFSGSGAPPAQVVFDGTREDGSVLGDGVVRAVMSARMLNGSEARSNELEITIDTVAPQATLAVTTAPQETETSRPLVFGAGDKQRLTGTIQYESSLPWGYELSYNGTLVESGALDDFLATFGIEPRPVSGGERQQVSLTWDGSLLDGSGEAPDGRYELVLSAQDPAGNTGQSPVLRTVKDTRTPAVRLTVDGEYLSPLSETAVAEVVFRTEFGAPELIEEFLFEIRNAEDRMVRSSYQRQGFQTFAWNGLTNGGTVVADGSYTGRLTVIYQNGHVAETTGVGPVIVDQTRPLIQRLAADPRRFSPDGDGVAETVTILQQVGTDDPWVGRIVTDDGTEILSRDWGTDVENFTWDGRNAEGQIVPDGDYRYVLEATDPAGNSTREDVLITVGTQPLGGPGIDLTLRPQPFSPDDDGREDTLNIGIRVDAERVLSEWSAVIRDPDGNVFRSFSGTGAPPRSIQWDGLSDDGELVETAREYPLTVTVIDASGRSQEVSETIEVDILVMREGDRLRIRVSDILFAPNTPDLFLSDDEQLGSNLDTLRRLARILNRYPERDIIVEGHAAHIFLEDPARRQEQEQVLIPLSRARATEVMQALMILGVDRERMSIEAYGGSRPMVPHSNRAELWRNRRVEFLLQRPQD